MVEHQLPFIYRLVNGNDPVPHIPRCARREINSFIVLIHRFIAVGSKMSESLQRRLDEAMSEAQEFMKAIDQLPDAAHLLEMALRCFKML